MKTITFSIYACGVRVHETVDHISVKALQSVESSQTVYWHLDLGQGRHDG